MHKILIYFYVIHLLKSSTCFEHYPAHLQEVYVVIVYMQPLVSSSLSAGDCLLHWAELLTVCNPDLFFCRPECSAKSLKQTIRNWMLMWLQPLQSVGILALWCCVPDWPSAKWMRKYYTDMHCFSHRPTQTSGLKFPSCVCTRVFTLTVRRLSSASLLMRK